MKTIREFNDQAEDALTFIRVSLGIEDNDEALQRCMALMFSLCRLGLIKENQVEVVKSPENILTIKVN